VKGMEGASGVKLPRAATGDS